MRIRWIVLALTVLAVVVGQDVAVALGWQDTVPWDPR